MTGRLGAICALLALAAAPGALAHDSGPEIARAVEALRQGPIWFDGAAPVSEQQADAVHQRLSRSEDISVAILPPDPTLGAKGAARELDAHLGQGGTIVALVGQDLGAWSTTVDEQALDALVLAGRQVYQRDGAVPALLGLIDGIEIAEQVSPAEKDGGGLSGITIALVAALAAGSVLGLFALWRGRPAAKSS
jgi:hypothetical protein